jgi:hypothetical protein
VRAALATGAALLLVAVPHVGNTAELANLESYRVSGTSRGVETTFKVTDSIFDPLLHVGVPYARTNLKSEAGGSGDAVGAQLYPGDLLISQGFDGFPGISVASYPPGTEEEQTYPPIPAGDGPFRVATVHATASASPSRVLGVVDTVEAELASGAEPIVSVGSVRVRSEGARTAKGVVQESRSSVKDIVVRVSEDLSVLIGSVISEARASSDGIEATAEGRLRVTDAAVTLGGETFPVAIDDEGLHVPDEVRDVLGVPLDLEQEIRGGLRQAGISISTVGPVEIVDGANGDASVGGVVVGITGEVPVIPIPQLVAQIIRTAQEALPPEATQPICFQDDIDPSFPVPLCLSLQAVPGPGSKTVQTITFGSVTSTAAATPGTPDDGNGGTGIPGNGGNGLPGPVDTGPVTSVPPGGETPGGGPPSGPGGLTGLLARMPPAPLAIAGLVLLILALLAGAPPRLAADEEEA